MIFKDINLTPADFAPAVSNYLQANGLHGMDVRAALCDMDGTLYNSMPRHAEAWRAMMLTQGIDAPIERFFAFEGRTGADTINILMKEYKGITLSPEQCAELYKIKSANFRRFQETEGIDPIEGAPQLIARLMEHDVTPVLVTGSGQGSLLGRLDHDYPGAFPLERRITARDVTRGKPDPQPYLKALELAKVSRNEAFVLENAPLGVQSGHAAGIFTVAVNTGPIPLDELDGAGADVTFISMPQCRDAFPALFEAMRMITL